MNAPFFINRAGQLHIPRTMPHAWHKNARRLTHTQKNGAKVGKDQNPKVSFHERNKLSNIREIILARWIFGIGITAAILLIAVLPEKYYVPAMVRHHNEEMAAQARFAFSVNQSNQKNTKLKRGTP